MNKKDLEKNEEYVECVTCGHILSKKRAQVVTQDWSLHSLPNDYSYYCELHNKPYDTIAMARFIPFKKYYKRMQVSEDGTPIGYIKEPTKKITKK